MKIFSVLLLILIVQLLTACGGGGGSGNNSKTSNTVLSSQQISSSVSSSSSSLSSQNNPLILLVEEKSIDETLLHIGYIPEAVESGESLTVNWLAYSPEDAVPNVVCEQKAGPEVELIPFANHLLIHTHQPGEVVITATATDANNNVITKEINFSVTAKFSEKAQLISGNANGVGLDLVIVGDGFLAEDQNKLKQAAYETIEFLFQYDEKRLNNYQSMFNLWVIDSVSSTRTIPTNGEPGNTLFGSFFNCRAIERLLCIEDVKVLSYVSNHVPQHDQILVLVNSEKYGGAGGIISTASLHDLSKHVAVHELGHSLAGLADEYSYGNQSMDDSGEPIEPNVTINKNPRSVKWNYWYENPNNIPGVDRFIFDKNDVGYFAGGKYYATGIWRPIESSFMRDVGGPLGAVNTEALALSIWRYYQGKSFVVPANKILTLSEKPVIFHIHPPMNINNVNVQWWVNDELVSGTNKEYFLILSQIDQSIKSVRVRLEDATGMIRRDPDQRSKIEYEWVTE